MRLETQVYSLQKVQLPHLAHPLEDVGQFAHVPVIRELDGRREELGGHL